MVPPDNLQLKVYLGSDPLGPGEAQASAGGPSSMSFLCLVSLT